MLTTLGDIVGYELVGCTFGKAWMRLEFTKSNDGQQEKLFVDTNNLIRMEHQAAADSPSDGVPSAVLAVYACLESTVSGIQVASRQVTFQFRGGASLTIYRDDESMDNLLKMTDPDSGTWLVVD